MAKMPDRINVTVSVLTAERLGHALGRIGPGAIEEMAFDKNSDEWEDEYLNVRRPEAFPHERLARAILRELER